VIGVLRFTHANEYSMPIRVLRKTAPTVRGPIGFCIYCGDRDQNGLTREHVMPIGLEGGYILRKASCESCRRKTHEVETICLRQMYFDYRRRNNLIRHKDDMPPHIPLTIDFEPDRNRQFVRPEDHPPVFLMPAITNELPGILTGGVPTERVNLHYMIFGDADELRRLQIQNNGSLISVRVRFDHYAFFRMLAKIAHSFAVGEIGIENFDPELPDLILGRNPHLISYLIGGSTEPSPHISFQFRHEMQTSIATRGDVRFAVIQLRLFASSGAPEYNVVVGRITNWPAVQRRLGLV
jgi:hypothetical protein